MHLIRMLKRMGKWNDNFMSVMIILLLVQIQFHFSIAVKLQALFHTENMVKSNRHHIPNLIHCSSVLLFYSIPFWFTLYSTLRLLWIYLVYSAVSLQVLRLADLELVLLDEETREHNLLCLSAYKVTGYLWCHTGDTTWIPINDPYIRGGGWFQRCYKYWIQRWSH